MITHWIFNLNLCCSVRPLAYHPFGLSLTLPCPNLKELNFYFAIDSFKPSIWTMLPSSLFQYSKLSVQVVILITDNLMHRWVPIKLLLQTKLVLEDQVVIFLLWFLNEWRYTLSLNGRFILNHIGLSLS